MIGPQDCDSLKIIMRSVFLQYSANQPNNISKQITELNKSVLEYLSNINIPIFWGNDEEYKKNIINFMCS